LGEKNFFTPGTERGKGRSRERQVGVTPTAKGEKLKTGFKGEGFWWGKTSWGGGGGGGGKGVDTLEDARDKTEE